MLRKGLLPIVALCALGLLLAGPVSAAGPDGAAVADSGEVRTITYEYDTAGRLLSVDYGDEQSAVSYVYDAAGNLLQRRGTMAAEMLVLPLILR